MKKVLLLTSLVLLVTALGLETAELIEYAKTAGIASIGTFLIGFAYPTY